MNLNGSFIFGPQERINIHKARTSIGPTLGAGWLGADLPLYIAWKGESDSAIWWSFTNDWENWQKQQPIPVVGTSAEPAIAGDIKWGSPDIPRGKGGIGQRNLVVVIFRRRELVSISSREYLFILARLGAWIRWRRIPMTTLMFNVRDYGATGSGQALDTPGVNAAITAAANVGGGTVYFPAGTYLCFSIHLLSNVHLYLAQGSTILAADFPKAGETTGQLGAPTTRRSRKIPRSRHTRTMAITTGTTP